MNKILNHKDKNKLPIINKYLDYKMNKKNENDIYSLDKLNLFNKVLNIINDKYSHKITRIYAEKTFLKDTEIYKNVENSILIDKFINYYNGLKITDNNGNEIILKIDKNKLSDFVIDDNNEIGKTYKNIYKIFIEKQNKEIEDILTIKIKDGIFNSNCKNKINIQQIREDEIFIFDKFALIEILFNFSYRTIIDTKNYGKYNSFETDFWAIEENMTEIFIKNKKLLNEDLITDFSYNNTIFDNQIKDLITTFKKSYKTKDITSDDKEIINNFIKSNKGISDKYRNIINDFISLIEYLNSNKKDKVDKGKEVIYDVIINLNNISNEFLKIFEGKKSLTVNKIFKLFNYYLESIFPDVKEEINKYQEKNENAIEIEEKIDKKSLKILNDYYFLKEIIIISIDELENAIRLFITLVLYRETDKENKIKLNRKNVFNNLNSPDFWNNKIYKNDKFLDDFNELKLCDIPINHILHLYNYLISNEMKTDDKIK